MIITESTSLEKDITFVQKLLEIKVNRQKLVEEELDLLELQAAIEPITSIQDIDEHIRF